MRWLTPKRHSMKPRARPQLLAPRAGAREGDMRSDSVAGIGQLLTERPTPVEAAAAALFGQFFGKLPAEMLSGLGAVAFLAKASHA